MRGGLLVGLALLAALAWWLLRGGAGVDDVGPAAPAPTVERASARAEEPEAPSDSETLRSSAGPAEPAEVDPEHAEVVDAPQPVARLTIHAFLPDGRPWAGAQLQLSGDESPLEGPIPMSPTARGATPGVVFRAIRGSHQTLFLVTDAQGALSLSPITPGVELLLEARDSVGTLASSTDGIVLGPGEQRGVELVLDRHPRTLRGRCIDPFGQLLEGVDVSVRGPELGDTVETLEDGAFELGPLFAHEVTLRATRDELIAVQRVTPPADGSEVTVVLRPGRTVEVETVDADGERVAGVEVAAHDIGQEQPLDYSYARSGWRQRLTLLPHRPLELRWGTACAPGSRTIDAETEHVRLVVARPGTLEVVVGPLPGGLEAIYAVGVTCPDGRTPAATARGIQNTGHQRLTWRLSPGSYGLQLLRLPATSAPDWQPWGLPVTVEVRPGETTVADLGG